MVLNLFLEDEKEILMEHVIFLYSSSHLLSIKYYPTAYEFIHMGNV